MGRWFSLSTVFPFLNSVRNVLSFHCPGNLECSVYSFMTNARSGAVDSPKWLRSLAETLSSSQLFPVVTFLFIIDCTL